MLSSFIISMVARIPGLNVWIGGSSLTGVQVLNSGRRYEINSWL